MCPDSDATPPRMQREKRHITQMRGQLGKQPVCLRWRYRAFAAFRGLRQSNVLQLEWSCVDLARCHAWVRSENSKNRKPISVNLNARAMDVLNRQIGKHPVRVFTCNGKPISEVVNQTWKSALARAGIQDLRWHDLRHTWATWLRQLGTPTHELQRMGGWKTAAMVERYAHVAPDHLAQAAARLESVGVGYDLATVNQAGGEKLDA